MADHIEDTMHDDEFQRRAQLVELLRQGPPLPPPNAGPLPEIEHEPVAVLDFVVKLPGKDAPGYLGRMRRLVQFQDIQKRGELDLETYDAMVEFILDFIVSPPRDEARELLLWQVSEAQLGELMAAISGGAPAVPPQ